MVVILQLFLHLVIKLAGLIRPGGTKSLIAENLLLRQQLIVATRGQYRCPSLNTQDRLIMGLLSFIVNKSRINKLAILLKPATLLSFHKTLVKRKYRKLYSSLQKPGPKGPSQELIDLVLQLKQQNPRMGYDRITAQIQEAFGLEVDKHVVRRILQKHFKPNKYDSGPSWLTFLGQQKDSLWSIDLFRCESISLKSHWVMVAIDIYSRRIIGLAVHAGNSSGPDVCRMFNQIQSGKQLPKYISTDNDPLFQYRQWKANLRILEIEEVKTIPYVPRSHPFVERVIGTTRREFLDHTLFWNERDLLRKLNQFKGYYNNQRGHTSLNNLTPNQKSNGLSPIVKNIDNYRWRSFCNNLFKLPDLA